MNNLSGRIAVITGASSGIGRAVALSMAEHGAQVIVNARRRDRLDKLASEINAGGELRAVAVPGDAASPETIDTLLRSPREHFSHDADIFVVNAGRGLGGSVVTSDISQWEEVIRTNVQGALRLMRSAALQLMETAKSQKWPGRSCDIVVMGSISGRTISPFSSLYGTTKFAINSAAEAMRRELAPHGIRVSLIEPAIVQSEFQSVAGYDAKWFNELGDRIGPFLQPEDVARLIHFIVSQPAAVHVSDVVIRPTRQDSP